MAANDGKSKSFVSAFGNALRSVFSSKDANAKKYKDVSQLKRTKGYVVKESKSDYDSIDDDFNDEKGTFKKPSYQKNILAVKKEFNKKYAKGSNVEKTKNTMVEKDDSRQNWDKDAVLHLMKTCTSKILFVGKYHSGKTSIARSLVGNEMYMTSINDRTIVMNFKIWKIAENVTATIYDLGGHPTYEHTVHFFYSDDVNNTVVITHKLTSDDYDACAKWLKSAIRSSPSATILFALTKCDLSDVDKLESLEQKFHDYIKKEIIKEIRELEISVHMNSKQDTKDRLQKVLNAYRKLHKEFKEKIYTLSCTPEPSIYANVYIPVHGNKFAEFRDQLVSLSREKYRSIPTLYHKVYTEIGKLGIKEDDKAKPPNQDKGNKTESEEKINSPDLKADASDEDVIEPDFRSQKLQYQSFDTVIEIYKNAYLKLNGRDIEEESDIKYQVSACLECLHSLGLVIWYGDDKITSNIIFNDVAALTDMLSAIFRHDLKDKLTFDYLDVKAKVQYKNKSQHFQKDVLKLTEKGIMTYKLLYSLLCPFHFEEHLDQVVVLLEKIGICHRNKDKEVQIFIPWFCEDHKIPEKLENVFEWILQTTKTSVVKCFSFTGRIPIEMFYYLCINLYKQYETTDHTQEREIWRNGFWAWLGDMALLIIYEEDKAIHVIVKSNVFTIDSTKILWKEIRFINGELERLSKEWWVSAIRNVTIICDGCLLLLPNVATMVRQTLQKLAAGDKVNGVFLSISLEFQTWDLENIVELTSDDVKSCKCQKHSGVLPACLFHPLPEDQEIASAEHQKLLHYLKQNAPGETNKQWFFPESCTAVAPLIHPEEIQHLKAKVEFLSERAEQQDALLNPEKIKHSLLRDNYDILVDCIVPDDIIRMLVSSGIISIEDFQGMENDITPDKVRKIIYLVDKQGEQGIRELISCFERSNQCHLVKILQKH